MNRYPPSKRKDFKRTHANQSVVRSTPTKHVTKRSYLRNQNTQKSKFRQSYTEPIKFLPETQKTEKLGTLCLNHKCCRRWRSYTIARNIVHISIWFLLVGNKRERSIERWCCFLLLKPEDGYVCIKERKIIKSYIYHLIKVSSFYFLFTFLSMTTFDITKIMCKKW